MDDKNRKVLIGALGWFGSLLFLVLVGIRIINWIERGAQTRRANQPLTTKVVPKVFGRWVNDRGYLDFQSGDKMFGTRYVSYSLERLKDGVKEAGLVTGGGPEYWLNREEGGNLVFVKKLRFTFDDNTLTFQEENGPQEVFQRKAQDGGAAK